MRSMGTAGMRRATSSASSTSPAVGAPKDVPSCRGGHDRLDDLGVGVAVDERPPRADVVDVAVAVDVDELRALAALDEDRRRPADRRHRPHRRVDPAGDELLGAGGEGGGPGVRQARDASHALNSSVKYWRRIFLNSVEE